MAEVPQKIIEISGASWMGGISQQGTLPIDGAFRSASNFDPFTSMGVFVPSYAPVQITSFSANAFYNVGFSSGGLGYFYSFGNSTKVFQLKTTDASLTDQSANLKDVATIQGATSYKGDIIYAADNAGAVGCSIRAQVTPLNGVQIGLTSALTGVIHAMKIGPDRNLYFTNGPNVGRITSVTGTAGNNQNYLAFESDVITRDIESVGDQLAILGDTNPRSYGQIGRFRCFIAFWNMKSQDLTRIWEWEDTITFGMKFTGEEVIIFAQDGIYTCTVDSPPRMIMSFQGNSSLTSFNIYQGAIIRKGNQVLFGLGPNIYYYGRPNSKVKKIFAHVYTIPTGNVQSLFWDGTHIWATTDANSIYTDRSIKNTPTTTPVLDTAIIQLADLDFKKIYKMAYARIILNSPLASGQSVQLQIKTAGGNKLVTDSEGMTFAADGAIYGKNIVPKGSRVPQFKDLTNISITNQKASIRSVEIYAVPADESASLSF